MNNISFRPDYQLVNLTAHLWPLLPRNGHFDPQKLGICPKMPPFDEGERSEASSVAMSRTRPFLDGF
jgi:hypothetical protein